MEMFSMIIDFTTNPILLLMIFIGTLMGLVFGAIPGLTATMGVALLVPITFTMEPLYGISLMLGTYIGGVSGSMIPAIIINIPGTQSSVTTTFDGYPMAQQGKAAQAIGWGVTSSALGTLVSWIILVSIAPQVAKVALQFGAPEYAALAFFGLIIIAAISGDSIVKGIIGGLIGIWLSFFGIDPIQGNLRFTFDSVELMSGINLIPALIGFFAIPQILTSVTSTEVRPKADLKFSNIFPSLKDLWKQKINILRSSVIGTVVGSIPATGTTTATFISYDMAKRFSNDRETFGKGNPDGVVASESANNGVIGGALLPLTTLGIPGDTVTAVLLGGLVIHGIHPGPELFTKNADIMIGIFTIIPIGTLFMFLIQIFGIKYFVRALTTPINYLLPALAVLSFVGAFALRNSYFDVFVTLVLGLFGYLLVRANFPTAPIVLGLVLGPILESEVRRALNYSDGSWMIFVSRPVSGSILAITLIFLIGIIYGIWKKRRTSINT